MREGNADYESKLSELLDQKSPLGRARLLISLASQILEDRLPSSPIKQNSRDKVEHYLKQIDLKQIDQGRQSIIVAMSMIKHSIAMADFDFARGEDIIQSMIGVGSIDDSIIVNLRTKEAISKYISGIITLNEVSEIVDANCHIMDNLLMSESLRLRFAEVLIEHDFDAAKMRFEQLTNPDVIHSLQNFNSIFSKMVVTTLQNLPATVNRRCENHLSNLEKLDVGKLVQN